MNKILSTIISVVVSIALIFGLAAFGALDFSKEASPTYITVDKIVVDTPMGGIGGTGISPATYFTATTDSITSVHGISSAYDFIWPNIPSSSAELWIDVSNDASYFGGTVSISGNTWIDGIASISDGFQGVGLTDCDAATTSKLLWDTTTKKFSCGTDQSTGSTHYLLGAWHINTLAASVSRGSLIYGNSTPAWAELGIGASGSFVMSDGTDLAWNDINHDWLTGFVANEHLDWTSSVGTIDTGNYIEQATEVTNWIDDVTLGSSGALTIPAGQALLIGTADVIASESFASWAIASVQYDLTNYWKVYADRAGAVTKMCCIATSGTSKEAEGIICSGGICGEGGSVDGSLTCATTWTCDDGALASASFGAGDSITASVSEGDDSGGTDGVSFKIWVEY